VTALITIGNIVNFQVVYSLRKQRGLMIGLLSIFWMSGIRNLKRSSPFAINLEQQLLLLLLGILARNSVSFW